MLRLTVRTINNDMLSAPLRLWWRSQRGFELWTALARGQPRVCLSVLTLHPYRLAVSLEIVKCAVREGQI
jgi:hypothetical protein